MKTEFNRKQRGSVLLTVLFVMTILIIFLMGTLALSIATNDRAHVNYSSAQTGITARDVTESVIKSLVTPDSVNPTATRKKFTDAVDALNDKNPGPLTFDVDINGLDTGKMGHVDGVEISYAGKKQYYDTTSMEWQDVDIIKVTANVTMSGVTSTSSVYLAKSQSPMPMDDEGGGAGFVTASGATVKSQMNIYGGSYISLPTLTEARNYIYRDDHVAELIHGDKATNKNYRGFSTDPKESFWLVNSGSYAEADLFVNNNMFIDDWSGFVFPTKGTGITVMGDLIIDNDSGSQLNWVYNGKRDGLNFNEMPYIYVDGRITGVGTNLCLGSKSDVAADKLCPLNTFCGWIEAGELTASGSTRLNTNLYCMDTDMTSYIFQSTDANLKIWTESVVTKAKKDGAAFINGEVCSNNDLVLSNCKILGDVRVKGDLLLNEGSTVYVGGNVVVEGEIKIVNVAQSGGVNSYTDSTKTGEAEIRNILKDATGGDCKIYNAAFSLPDGSAGTKHNLTNLTGTFYKHTVTVDADGKYCDPWGNPLSDGKKFEGGLPKDGAEVDNIDIYYLTTDPDNPTLENAVDGEFWYDEDTVFVPSADPKKYYAETSVEVGKFNKSDPDSSEKKANYSKLVNSATFEYCEATQAFLASVGEKYVYPEYGMRDAVLGIHDYKQVKGVKDEYKESLKVAKTLEEVLTTVTNPYEKSKIPEAVKTIYNTITGSDMDKLDSGEETYTKSKYVAEYDFSKKAKYYKGGVVETDPNQFQNAEYAELDSDAVLCDANLPKKLIIKAPDSGYRLVLIRGNCGANSGCKIIIDDKDNNSGRVVILIDKNSSYKCTASNSAIITSTYDEAFSSCHNWLYNSAPRAGYKDLQDLNGVKNYMPHVYIYGKQNSELYLEAHDAITANILSTELTFRNKASTNNPYINSLIYNNHETMTVSKPSFMIGCCNAMEVELPNQIVNIYVTDGEKKWGEGGEYPDANYYYNVYASEF